MYVFVMLYDLVYLLKLNPGKPSAINLYCIKGALALFVLGSFSGYVCYMKLNTQLSSPR